jgi:signal peptidase I
MSPAFRFLRDLVLALSVALLVVLAATRFVAIPWVVSGPSMEPTLRDGDRVLVDLWTYGRRPPRPGEIALLEGPGGVALVKRVAGARVDPDRIPARSVFRATEGDEAWIPVAGDNPSHSDDSRTFGPVPVHRFRGRIVWRYWPLYRIGSIR